MQENPRQNRDWEHWPGRHAPEDGVRHRLRALFVPSDDVEAVEQLIAERGRELERRTEQLTTTIEDLNRREEHARSLRDAVERMLRSGSAELDERHASLELLAADLVRREKLLADAEADVERRRIELGAVELRRASLERREEALERRATELERRTGELDRETALAAEIAERQAALETAESDVQRLRAELERRAAQLEESLIELVAAREALTEREQAPPPPEQTSETTRYPTSEYVAVVAGDRYRLVVIPGPPPEPGARVAVDGSRFDVVRIGVSPLPGDDRAGAFLTPVAAE